MSQSKILVMPVDPVHAELLGRLQWALLKAFRRPAVILEEFAASPDAATWEEVEERIQGALLKLQERSLDHVSAVVVLSQKSLENGAIGQARESPIAAHVVHCPLEGFKGPYVIRAIVHTVGHTYGLPCCHSIGCVMNHWDCCVYADRSSLDPKLCADCARTLASRMGADLPKDGGTH
jgi:hypothetical protein